MTAGIAVLVFVCACGEANRSAASEGTEFEAAESSSEAGNSFPSTAVGAIFQVEDLDQWTNVYQREVDESARIGTLQSLDNPNLIFVMQWSEGHREAKQLASSEDVKAVMMEGTMSSDPQFQFYNIKFFENSQSEDSFRLAVSAEVMNFDMWKSDFDRDERKREEAGLKTIGLAIDSENENLVYVMFSTNDQQKVYEFLGSEETKAAISDAGVIGEPNMSWWKVVSR